MAIGCSAGSKQGGSTSRMNSGVVRNSTLIACIE